MKTNFIIACILSIITSNGFGEIAIRYLPSLPTLRTVANPAPRSNRVLGSKCGLVDSTEDKNFIELNSIGLDHASKKEVQDLDETTKAQLLVAARTAAEGESGVILQTAFDAVRYLRADGGLTVIKARAGATAITLIRNYPGENPYGVLFKTGRTEIIAQEKDGDIVCANQ